MKKLCSFDDQIVALAKKFLAMGPFQRPLRFGDPEQIRFLKTWRQELSLLAEQEASREAGEFRRFLVCYSYREEKEIEVEALNREDAEEAAYDEIFEEDIEIESVTDVGSVQTAPINKAA